MQYVIHYVIVSHTLKFWNWNY